MQELRANTEVIVPIGPFPDVGDGFTPQVDIDISGTNEAELLKHGSVAVVDISGATWAAITDCRGYYGLTLTTSHTNAEGMLTVIIQDDSDCLPVRADFMVLSQAAYDSKYLPKDSGLMDVNLKSVDDDTDAPIAMKNGYNGTGLLGDTYPARQDQLAAAAGGLAVQTTMQSVTVIQGSEQDLANAATSDDSRWTGDDDGAGAEFIFLCTPAISSQQPVVLHFEGYYDEPIGATNSAILQVYNFQTAAWETILTLTKASADEVHDPGLVHAHAAPTDGTLETVAYVQGDVLLKFEQVDQETGDAVLLIDKITVGFIGTLVDAAEIADAVWQEILAGHLDAGSAGLALSTAFTVSEVKQIRKALGLSGDTQATSGTSHLDLVKAKTDKLTFDVSNYVKAVEQVKTGFGLAADGLTALTVAESTQILADMDFQTMLVRTMRRFVAKSELDVSAGWLQQFANDGTTPTVKQSVAEVAGVQTVGMTVLA